MSVSPFPPSRKLFFLSGGDVFSKTLEGLYGAYYLLERRRRVLVVDLSADGLPLKDLLSPAPAATLGDFLLGAGGKWWSLSHVITPVTIPKAQQGQPDLYFDVIVGGRFHVSAPLRAEKMRAFWKTLAAFEQSSGAYDIVLINTPDIVLDGGRLFERETPDVLVSFSFHAEENELLYSRLVFVAQLWQIHHPEAAFFPFHLSFLMPQAASLEARWRGLEIARLFQDTAELYGAARPVFCGLRPQPPASVPPAAIWEPAAVGSPFGLGLKHLMETLYGAEVLPHPSAPNPPRPVGVVRHSVLAAAPPLDAEAPPLGTEAQPFGAEAQPFDAEAPPLDAEAQPFDAEAQPFDAEAQPLDAEAQPFDAAPVAAESGRPAGRPADGAEKPFAELLSQKDMAMPPILTNALDPEALEAAVEIDGVFGEEEWEKLSRLSAEGKE